MKKKKPSKEDPQFEIKFFENLLKKKPDFIEALSALGDLYTKEGFYQKGLEIDQELARLKPDDPIVLYNLACSYSLLKQTDQALLTIRKAVDCGYNDMEYLCEDRDLENLRQDKRFQQMLQNIKRKISQSQA